MSTKLLRGLNHISSADQGGIVTIGNFDGVHLGHQALIREVVERARSAHLPSTVITFEPHPFEFFKKYPLTIPRITRLREKFAALSACGIDNVLILPFNQRLVSMRAQAFIQEILVNTLHIKQVILGEDFHFGYKREGDVVFLQKEGQRLGFTVVTMPDFKVDDVRVSSTEVREALGKGDLKQAEKLLGRSYSMMGRIRTGDQIGRQWGFPTANIFLHRKITPLTGIYTVYMHGITPEPWPGVANVGMRPTMNGTRCLLEVHLLNFNQTIYGHDVEVQFCKKLREEERFPTIELLKKQIAADVAAAYDYFDLEKKGAS